MLTTLRKIFVVYLLSFSLMIFQMPVYGASLEEAVDFGAKLSGLSLEAQTSEVTATAIGVIASHLNNYEHKTADILYASSGGSGYVFSLTASITKEEGIDALMDQFTKSSTVGSTDTLAFLEAQI